MEKKRRKKRTRGLLASRFYRVYFAVVAVALVVIAAGLVWLNGLVRDYETSQPIHAAEAVARLFEEGDYARIYALDTAAEAISGGDEAYYVDSLSALMYDGDVAWREIWSGDSGQRKYAVTLDGERLATFTLVPSGERTAHGYPLWTLGSVTTNLAVGGTEAAGDLSAAPYRVSVPDGYAVTVNGRTLGPADALATGEPVLPEGFLPEGVQGPTMTRYAFFCEDGAPEVTATDATGAAVELTADGENAWICPPKEDAALREQYGGAVIKLAERVAKYTVKDLSRSAILGNVASDSPAETILSKFSNEWAPSHRTSTVSDARVTDFYVLSDDCFTCHVDFTFTLRTRRGNDYVYPTSYTFCVVRRRGKGKLYNLTFN